MKWFKKHWITIIIIVALLAGLGLLLYPSIADSWNRIHQSRAIASYTEAVASMDAEEEAGWIADARAYNRHVAQRGIVWEMSDEERAEYDSLLDVTDTGIMGYININKIDETLPIYHGTAEDVLQRSIGHLEGTSLPVGAESFDEVLGTLTDPEEGVHSVISGHRGLPSAKLFSDLDEMEEGDVFTLSILDQTYFYQVDQILVVEPNDLSDLVVEKGKDYCTLVTCTPYGINTHRLLVRGHRVAPVEEPAEPDIKKDPKGRLYLLAIVTGLIVLIVLNTLFLIRKKKKQR